VPTPIRRAAPAPSRSLPTVTAPRSSFRERLVVFEAAELTFPGTLHPQICQLQETRSPGAPRMLSNSSCHGHGALQATVIAYLFHPGHSLGPRRVWHRPCYLGVSKAVFFNFGPLMALSNKGENIC